MNQCITVLQHNLHLTFLERGIGREKGEKISYQMAATLVSYIKVGREPKSLAAP